MKKFIVRKQSNESVGRLLLPSSYPEAFESKFFNQFMQRENARFERISNRSYCFNNSGELLNVFVLSEHLIFVDPDMAKLN